MENLEVANSALERANELIKPYRLRYVDIREACVFLERNAHFMDKSTMDMLVDNIREDGFLSQIPFAMRRDDGKYLILSGNHRVKAAMKAGLEYILLLYVENITKDKQIGYQLSHNRLVGKDDLQTVREIFKELETIEGKRFSGFDDSVFASMDNIKTKVISCEDVNFTEVKFMFVDAVANEIKDVLCKLEKMDLKGFDGIVVNEFDGFVEAITSIEKRFEIKSLSSAFGKLIDIAKRYLDGEKDQR